MQGKLLNTTKSLWYPGYKKWCTFPFGGGGGGGGSGGGGGGFTNPDEKQYPSFKNTYCFPKGASEETKEQVGFSREEIL